MTGSMQGKTAIRAAKDHQNKFLNLKRQLVYLIEIQKIILEAHYPSVQNQTGIMQWKNHLQAGMFQTHYGSIRLYHNTILALS